MESPVTSQVFCLFFAHLFQCAEQHSFQGSMLVLLSLDTGGSLTSSRYLKEKTLFGTCVTWLLLHIILQERKINTINSITFSYCFMNQLLKTTELLNMSELSSSALMFAKVSIWCEKAVRFQVLRIFSLKSPSKSSFHN